MPGGNWWRDDDFSPHPKKEIPPLPKPEDEEESETEEDSE